VDQGHNLRGKTINLTVSWDIMPHSGRIFTQVSKEIVQFQLPFDYV
jgi:hypothetical protein